MTKTQTIQVQEVNEQQPELTEQQLVDQLRKEEKDSGQVRIWFFLKMYLMAMGACMGGFMSFNGERILVGAIAQNIPKEYVYFLYTFMGVGVVGSQLVGIHALVYGHKTNMDAEGKARRLKIEYDFNRLRQLRNEHEKGTAEKKKE